MKRKLQGLLNIAVTLCAVYAGPAFSQQYPSRTIKIVVPASAGTSIDAVARYFADAMSKTNKTSVIVENRPGAGGLLAYDYLSKAPRDGYSILMSGLPLYILPFLSETTVRFDPIKDFTPITRVGRTPLALVVRSDSPYHSLEELVRAMKEKPSDLTYSSQGLGSGGSLCAAQFNEANGTKARHIAYKETTLAVTDVIGGHVTFTCQGSVAVLPLIQSGKLRALAVTSTQRWESLPKVPTVAQTGVAGFEMSPGLEFIAPAGTPLPVIEFLSALFTQIGRGARYKKFLDENAISFDLIAHDKLKDLVPKEAAGWKRIAGLVR